MNLLCPSPSSGQTMQLGHHACADELLLHFGIGSTCPLLLFIVLELIIFNNQHRTETINHFPNFHNFRWPNTSFLKLVRDNTLFPPNDAQLVFVRWEKKERRKKKSVIVQEAPTNREKINKGEKTSWVNTVSDHQPIFFYYWLIIYTYILTILYMDI